MTDLELNSLVIVQRIARTNPGIEIADSVDVAFTAKLAAGLGLHRVWGRAATVMASAAPPAG